MANNIQFFVDDTSPSISYFPFRDTFSTPNLSAGWNPYFDDSGFASVLGEEGNGTSLHITSLDGASISVQWHGTGIQLLGNATKASYTITLDGAPQAQSNITDLSNNILATFQNLPEAPHTLSLTASTSNTENPPNSSMLVFDKALVISSPPAAPSNLSYTSQVLNDSDIAFLGRWVLQNSTDADYRQSSTLGDRALAKFLGSSFLLTGTTSPTSGNYSVTLDNITTTLSGRSSFTKHDTLLYYATGLDSSITHVVQVRNEGGGDLELKVGGFGVFSAGSPTPQPPPVNNPTPSPTPSMSSNTSVSFPKGTIAAFVLAAILAFLLLTAAIFYFLVYRPRRRRRNALVFRPERNTKGQEAGIILDIGPNSDSMDHGLPPPDVHVGRRNKWDSGKSDFERWKRDMEGGTGMLAGLGIAFRHSDDDKGYTHYDEGVIEPESEPLSTRSSIFSSSSFRKAKKKAKGKARRISDRSWSPSFTLDFPPFKSSAAAAQQRAGDEGKGDKDPKDDHVSGIATLSYMSTPGATENLDLAPPSYDASMSNRNSGSNSGPTPPSVPRSVSHSQSSKPPTSPAAHNREGSRGFLLHYGEPNPGPPDEEPASQVVPTFRLSQADSIPLEAMTKEERGSVLDYSTDETASVLGDASARAALRSLSPRTSKTKSASRPSLNLVPLRRNDDLPPLPSTSVDPSTSKQVISVRPVETGRPSTNEGKSSKPEGRTRTRRPRTADEVVEVQNGIFLSVRETSPFRIDFAGGISGSPTDPTTVTYPAAAALSTGVSGLSHVRFDPSASETGEGKRQSLGNMLASEGNSEFVQGRSTFRLTPLTIHPPTPGLPTPESQLATSFLDLTAGSDSSLRSRSNTTTDSSERERNWGLLQTDKEKSRWSNTTAPSMATNHDRMATTSSAVSQISPVSESQSLSSSTFPIPFSVSIPPSPYHAEIPVNSQPRGSSSTSNPDHLHVHPPIENLESPTDSIPMSVSDLHFRNSYMESAQDPNSRRTSFVPHTTNHPPLPGLAQATERKDFMAPLSTPNYIVERVLGLNSPNESMLARTGHSRGGSSSAFFNTPLPSARADRYSSSESRDDPSPDNSSRNRTIGQ
ncbi:hypothetical protein BDQ12DRAFT_708173 [Crucibulum laeve]|uniref:Uncharacterized protein n=1 Tax=Crucibulum laeve TaxID=68775 RepID=A0A5C3MS54_9AGAR|nr:hypothetical protein BDQ12DRAFT_708173 [Crucibulum laeve]